MKSTKCLECLWTFEILVSFILQYHSNLDLFSCGQFKCVMIMNAGSVLALLC